jgi:hypothetical protein
MVQSHAIPQPGAVAAPRPRKPMSSRRLRSVAIVLLVVALAATAGLIWRNHVIHSPEHSLKRLATAIEQHDVATFQELVDVDTVVNRFIDASMAAAIADTADADFATMLGQGMIALMKPRIATEAKAAIIAAVEKGLPAKATAGDGLDAYSRRSGVAPDTFKGMSAITRAGATALVNLEFLNARIDSTVTVQLRMRDMRGFWQVSEIANAAELVTNIEAAEKRRLESFNRPIRERLSTTLVVEDLRKTAKDINSFFGGEVSLHASIRNASSATLAGFSVQLRLTNVDGHKLIVMPVSSTAPLAPGAAYTFNWHKSLGLFAGTDNRLVAMTRQQDIRPEIDCDRLELADGTVVKVFANLDEALATHAEQK